MIDFNMNFNSGLGKVIVVLDEKENKFKLLAQNPYASEVDYYTIASGIEDIKTAKIVRDTYIRGLFDGETFREQELKQKEN